MFTIYTVPVLLISSEFKYTMLVGTSNAYDIYDFTSWHAHALHVYLIRN